MGDSAVQPLNADEPAAIGPYRLLGRLGSGGMGRVYLGRSTGGRTVAVKVVHPHFALDEEFRARFRREVAAARTVGGAWTAPVLDADPDAPVPWVATGYVAGPSLTHAVAGSPDPSPLPEQALRVLGAGLAEALTEVHAHGLVHRDVKPSNVLLALDGPRLIDFGIARAVDGTTSLTSTGASIGSPGYMAPEQILGQGVTGAADVFSLGAVLVYAVSGLPPFPGDTSAALLYKVVHEEPELRALTGELRELAARCLAKDPAARPAPAELARALAPQGTRQLMTEGWLPRRLMEEVSRTAVSLLDLEATTADPPSTPQAPQVPPTPPRATDSPSTPPSSGASDAAARQASAPDSAPGLPGTAPPQPGVFGPPDPSYGDLAAAPAWPAPAATGVPSYATGGGEPRGGTGPADGETRRGPGRLSVTVDAHSTTVGPNSRGRKLSCTVALAVAGALAAVTFGSVFVFDLLPGSDSDSSQDAGPAPGASSPGGPSTGGAASAQVPAAYLGTWEGPAYSRGNELPLGTFELTVHQGMPGKKFAVMRQTDPLGGVCEVDLKLDHSTPQEVVATGQGRPDSAATCTKNAHTVHLVRTGDDLSYISENEKAGRPKARMEKKAEKP
ncbi:Ser/Thr protein kinase [Streptomyces albus]|uniref:Ser/Thr protein kinase n=1 Tax=Streptomyces albus (strain ATCC 21838 / DSM 41398 / FERM P-419 / JCM 4703 / NBRC 107858) TaxID=1081613 RepID=A0A0B5EV33_STRA4|nr:Ser/Thr protein kinase [Streptomyces albus]AOU77411.1 Ser/Thr protein kinase [Streptomyces albus]AYN33184.1 Ser/Thr protein kinase [Streptomyces albus]